MRSVGGRARIESPGSRGPTPDRYDLRVPEPGDSPRAASGALGRVDRALLLVPIAGGVVFGILPFFAQQAFASVAGYSGADAYIYRLAGAATFGYAVALTVGLRDHAWPAVRWVVLATLVFNAVSIVACAIEIAAGRAQPVVYLILPTSIAIVLITARLLAAYGVAQPARDVAGWIVWVIALATVAAALFGILPLFPAFLAATFGYAGTDAFVYRQAGAATLGYAVMGLAELRALRWGELRLPTVMALVFNGLSFVASVIELATRGVTLLDALVAPASLLFTILFVIALARRGR
jgi:hypothetical protein